MAIFAIPCGIAQAQPSDAAAANAALSADAQTSAGGTASVGASSSDADSSGGADEATAPAEVLQSPTEPPPAEPPAAAPAPPPTASGEESAAPPPSPPGDESPRTGVESRSGDPPAAPALGPSRSSAPNEGGDSAVAVSTPTAPAEPVTAGAGATKAPAVRPEPTAVEQLLPRLGTHSPPVDGRGIAVERRPARGGPLPGGRLMRMDSYIWAETGPGSASSRHVAAPPVERGGDPSPGTRPRDSGGRPGDAPSPAPSPSSPAPGSASASPGGGFFAAGLTSLAALLIALALPQLRARLELPPRGRCTVAFLRPLERPG